MPRKEQLPYKQWSEERKAKHRESMKKWKKKNRDKVLNQKKRYYTKNKDKWVVQRHKIERKYGIKEEDYKAMLEDQEYCCAICGNHFNTQKRRLAIDHDHKTGKIRGLLCDSCNLGLGSFKDDINILQSAIIYLM
jgi:hypothetical protein